MPKGLLDFAKMTEQLYGTGLLGQVGMNPYKKGLSPLQTLEGAMPYQGGRTVRAYHGTNSAPFERFDLSKAGTGEGSKREPGVFMSPVRGDAKAYGDRTIPLDVNLTNAAKVDWSKITKGGRYSSKEMSRAIELANKHNKDFLVIQNINDLGPGQTQIIALRPAGKVKNAATGATMFSGLLGALLSGEFERKEPLPPM